MGLIEFMGFRSPPIIPSIRTIPLITVQIIGMSMKTIASLLVLLAIASTASAQTVGTCRIFPPNNPWNTRIDTLPVHPRSQQYINSVGASIHLHPDFGSNPDYGIPWIAV